MKEEKINGHRVKFYESIDEMPILNFMRQNKYMLIDGGIGSDISDVESHRQRAIRLIEKQPQLAIQELINQGQAIQLISEQIHPESLAFAVMIAEIDGERITDISDTALQDVLKKLNPSVGFIRSILDWLKKKVTEEFELYFPGKSDARENEYFGSLKRRTLLILDGIIRDKDNSEAVNLIDEYLLTLSKPQIFYGAKSVEVLYEKNFEEMCLILINQNLTTAPKQMTTLEFYQAFEFLKKKLKQNGRKSD